MTTRRFMSFGFLCAALAVQPAFAAPDWSPKPVDSCPLLPGTAPIEVLPFFHSGGDTCKAPMGVECKDRADQCKYSSPTCTVPEVTYSGQDAIYKVSLHPGNRVAFHLDVEESADLALILIKDCGVGTSCVSNSVDFIGLGHDEEIPEVIYPPGDYYLYVDSADDGHCGGYTLTVTGVNPTPDLRLEIASSPQLVKAGDVLTYNLTVSNVGALAATGVRIIQSLPEDLTFLPSSDDPFPPSSDPRCKGRGREVLCTIGDLPAGGTERLIIEVLVAPRTRNSVSSTVEVKADEGDAVPRDNEQVPTTTVIAESPLSIEGHSISSDPVVAGRLAPLTYSFRIHNAGPSDATKVKVTDDLPDEVSFVRFIKAPSGCRHREGLIDCTISRISPKANMDVSFLVKVKPSARGTLTNRVEVTSSEDPKLHTDSLTTGVTRITDLSITKNAPAEAVAGQTLTYTLTVHNAGPSDSMGGKVTDVLLPAEVRFHSSDDCGGDEDGETVTCLTGPIASGRDQTLQFEVLVDPALPSSKIFNHASVVPKDQDEKDGSQGNNTSQPDTETLVEVEADLRLTMTEQQVSGDPPMSAGENLLYTMTVDNEGPSDSQGGRISDTLPGGLTFIASPDGCWEDGGTVICTVPPLAVGDAPQVRRFVAAVASKAIDPIENKACIASSIPEDDEEVGNDCMTTVTQIDQEADLAVTVSDAPDAVRVGGNLIYVLHVTNSGPSDAAGVTVSLTLPSGSSFVSASDLGCQITLEEGDDRVIVQCDLGALAAGATSTREIHILAPDERGTATATAEVSAGTTDPEANNDTAEATTTLAADDDPDLVVTKKAGVEAVVAGNLLRYTIEVANQGLAVASDVRVEDPLLPEEVDFIPSADGICMLDGQVVTCDLGPLEKDEKRTIALTVRVEKDFAGDSLSNTAYIPEDISNANHDPNKGNDEDTVITPVLHAPSLVVPIVNVASEPSGDTTSFVVKNHCEKEVCIRIDDFLGDEEPEGPPCIPGKGIYRQSVILRDQTWYLGITPVDPSLCPLEGSLASLSGDFTRIKNELANGLPLISTDTSRVPPELCRRWSTRFLNERSLVTEFLFFVPGNQGGKVTGKVYNEAGAFVQEISLTESREAFRSTTLEEFDDNVKLLANFGSIEWELPEGVVGNVAAVHRAAGQHAVAVPGFCRDGNLGAASDLIVPYFEVDSSKEISTLLAVRNETADTMDVSFNYFSADGALLSASTLALAGHATQTVNLKEVENVQGSGYVEIESTGTVSGDFMWIEPGRGAAGGALVDIGPDRVPPQLCKQWDVRFSQGVPEGAATAATDFIFYIPRDNKADEPDEPVATGQAYDEDGEPIVALEEKNPLFAFRIPARLTGSGSIEWKLHDPNKGYVAAVITTPGYSPVLVPGVCRLP